MWAIGSYFSAILGGKQERWLYRMELTSSFLHRADYIPKELPFEEVEIAVGFADKYYLSFTLYKS